MACALSWHARCALAAEEPLVLLDLDRCDDLDEGEMRRIVSAELGAQPTNAAGTDVTQITVTCEPPRVRIQVQDPLSRKSVQRSFDLGLAEPRARTRLVAIAATELVLGSWAELHSPRTLHVEPEGPKPSPEAVRAAGEVARARFERYEPHIERWYDAETPRDRQLRIMALASTRTFFSHRGNLTGGGIRVGEERFRFVGWSTDLLYEAGQLRNGDGPHDIFTLTAGGWLLLAGTFGPATGRLGAGLRAGLSGGPGRGALTPWGWPLGASSLTLRLSRLFVVEVSAEAGYATLPVENSRYLAGWWFSAQAGLGVTPDLGGGARAAGGGG